MFNDSTPYRRTPRLDRFDGRPWLSRWHITFRGWILLVLCIAWPMDVAGQTSLFGSIDDPTEQAVGRTWHASTALKGGAGFSLVGPQWYTAVSVDVTSRGSNYFLNLDGTLREGYYGAYAPDTDEAYDLVRLLRVARFQSQASMFYARLGPLDRTRFGTGHLVNFLNTTTAWDDRTVGLESRIRTDQATLEVFAEDVLGPGLAGARLVVRPFSGLSSKLSTLSLGASVVSDRKTSLSSKGPFDGQEAEARMEAYQTGGFSFFPFVSLAHLPGYGQGFSFGADLENDNFVDLARLHFRIALHYNSSDFRSGYFGSFYTVSSHRANVLTEAESIPAGYALRDVERGNSIETEIRILIFRRFEFWYSFLRYHGVQPLSEYHLRLLVQARRFSLSIGQDRRGLKGFRSLFGTLGDENRLGFDVEYQVYGPLRLQVRADYTYAKWFDSATGTPNYIVQRRFSPMIVFRYPTTVR